MNLIMVCPSKGSKNLCHLVGDGGSSLLCRPDLVWMQYPRRMGRELGASGSILDHLENVEFSELSLCFQTLKKLTSSLDKSLVRWLMARIRVGLGGIGCLKLVRS
ncbi:hypothetical protein [Shimia sp.]|uniref:hypothetical protein n=1 Tax=Shimia sp. TaxID=1954381 RepID=UPI003BAB30DE